MRTLPLFAALLTLSAQAATPTPTTPAAPPQVYSLRPDPRLCPSPMCGGWWLSRVNHAQMRCVDGSMAAACYVSRIDWTALNLPPSDEAYLVSEASAGRTLVRGSLYPVPFGGMTLGAMTPSMAWIEFP